MSEIKSIIKTYFLKERYTLKKIYDHYWERLYEICFRQTQDVASSEEMVQDIFISLWRRWDELEIESSLDGYLIKAAKLKVIDYYREKYIHRHQVVETKGLSQDDRAVLQITENEVEDKILTQYANNVIEKLPNQCQTVFRLSRHQQKTTREIAIELGISQKTVKNHLTKALSHMRLHLIDKTTI